MGNISWTTRKCKNAKTQKHTWHFARSVQKEVVFASWWKVDLFCESQRQKIMGRPGHTIHIDFETESLWQKDGLVHYKLSNHGEMVNNKCYQQQLTDLNRTLLEKGTEKGRTERGNIKSFFFMTMLHRIRQNRQFLATIKIFTGAYINIVVPTKFLPSKV